VINNICILIFVTGDEIIYKFILISCFKKRKNYKKNKNENKKSFNSIQFMYQNPVLFPVYYTGPN